MKVGDLVVRNMGDMALKHVKGVILTIRQVDGATYYKIAWFGQHPSRRIISDRWTSKEFCLFQKVLPFPLRHF